MRSPSARSARMSGRFCTRSMPGYRVNGMRRRHLTLQWVSPARARNIGGGRDTRRGPPSTYPLGVSKVIKGGIATSPPRHLAASPPRRTPHFVFSMASLITSTVLVRGQTMVITAVAGGGKSTVLLAYARAHLTQQFLHLTFNALVRQEKEAEFAAAGVYNVQVETVHSFSRRGVAKLEKGATADLSADATSLLTSLTCSRAADWPRARCQAVLRAFHSFSASDEPAEDEVLTKHASLFSKELLVAEGVKALWQAAARWVVQA